MNIKRKFMLGAIICLFAALLSVKPAYAMDTVNGDNYTSETAYNMGRYTDGKSITGVLPARQTNSYFKFTVNEDEKIYVRCSYNKEYTGMAVNLMDEDDSPLSRSSRVIDSTSVIPFLAVNCDGQASNGTFYVRVDRGSYDLTKPMYFSITLYNRVKSGHGTFNFSGKATNNGNSRMSLDGVDSNVIRLDLRNNSKIPAGAIVKRVSTSSTQSPNQGNVHHSIMPQNAGEWFTSTVSSATSGHYDITEADSFLVKQVWQFRYNAKASKKSTMSNVKLMFDWTYDLANTNYKAVI